MQLGDFHLRIVSGGSFRIDGGTMFGVVPRSLWSRVFPPDDANLIAQRTNCLVVDTGRAKILIDAGYGSKLPAKQRAILQAEEGDPLLQSLSEVGLGAGDIDLVVLTHLHFDHAGGTTRLAEDSSLADVFPNAEYVVNRLEWEIASAQEPELRTAYPLQNFEVLRDTGRLRLVDGEHEIAAGIWFLPTPGHTMGHQSVLLESQGRGAVYLGDICPTTRHLQTLWCMGYDVHMLEVRRQKPRILSQIVDNSWLAIFDHDPDHHAAYLARDDRKDFAVREAIVNL